jgi:hypothetical protein
MRDGKLVDVPYQYQKVTLRLILLFFVLPYIDAITVTKSGGESFNCGIDVRRLFLNSFK